MAGQAPERSLLAAVGDGKKDDDTTSTTGPATSSVAPDTVAVNYNGLIVPDEPTERGYGEWMLVTRKNSNKAKANGPIHHEAQKENKPKAHSTTKANPSNGAAKDSGPSKDDPGKKKGPMAQTGKSQTRSTDPTKNSPKPYLTKPKNSNISGPNTKGSSSQANHKFENNPLLKKPSATQQTKTSFSPTNAITIDLVVSNPNEPPDLILQDAAPPSATVNTNNPITIHQI